MEYRNKDSYLWSVLPLTGITAITTFSTSENNFPNTPLRKTRCFGIPYVTDAVYREGDYRGNTNLRVLNFTTSPNGPITCDPRNITNATTGPILYAFSATSILHFKWTAIDSGKPISKIGFYTSNWLSNSNNQDKYYLFPTDRGISMFGKQRGEFYTTGFTMFSVITEGSFALKLEVSYHNPKSLTIPKLSLYTPTVFAKWCNEVIATQELIDSVKGLVLIRPLPKYFAETIARLAYLETTAINLIFTNTLLTNKLTTTNLIRTVEFSNLPTIRSDDIRILGYDANVVNQGWSAGSALNFSMGVKSITVPGTNVFSIVSVEVERSFKIQVPFYNTTYLVRRENGVYGKLNVLTFFNDYSIRNQPCGFVIPASTFHTDITGLYEETKLYSFTTNIEANVESICLRFYGFQIYRQSGNVLTQTVSDSVIIRRMKIDFYEITI